MNALWDAIGFALHLGGATALFVLCAWLYPRRGRVAAGGGAIVAACAVMGAWGIVAAAFGQDGPLALALLCLSYLAWFLVLYRLFAWDGRHAGVRPIRAVFAALTIVELLHFGVVLAVWPASAMEVATPLLSLRLLSAVGALVLVHNLISGASPEGRLTLRWPAAALGAMWLYDLNLYTAAYLFGTPSEMLGAFRGALMPLMAVLLALGTARQSAEIRLRPSRSVTFQSFSLVVIGAYLAAMVLVAQGLSYIGGHLAWVAQIAFLAAAMAAALLILPSRRLRGWAKDALAKNLFQHRYDYRAEWLRFTQTIARGGEGVTPLHERVVQALADITDSPAGLLLTPSENGGAALNSRWQWGEVEVPAEALCAEALQLFQERQLVLDLDDIRAGREAPGEAQHIPEWLVGDRRAWVLVPLLHYQRLVGIVVLGRPPFVRKLDWEDIDLLRVVGRQLASYLAEHAGQEALGEAHRFDEFNRRMAFVMHDIKNLASQLSLLARNAEKHADKPEFRADMLVTLRNSADKLNTLLARLGRYGPVAQEQPEPLDVGECIARIAARYEAQHPVHVVERQDCEVLVDVERFEQALVHIVQNAIEASEPDRPVFLHAACDGLYCRIEVVDSGSGMSPEFIRTRLFKPFHSSKQGGFGIGAFEARELVRSMGGQLSVESREGVGTRFVIRLPLLATARMVGEHRLGCGAAAVSDLSNTAEVA